MARQHWQAALDEACPYLAGRAATTDYRILTDVTPLEHEAMLVRGWRRFGLQYFRPECAGCAECVSLRIPVATLKTFMPVIDRTLLGTGDYFQPDKFPYMHFRSTEMMHLKKDTREFSLIGELTVNGITRPVVLSAKVAHNGQGNPLSSGALTATSRFRRSDFGMNKMLGIVGDEMQIVLQVKAREAKAQFAAP